MICHYLKNLWKDANYQSVNIFLLTQAWDTSSGAWDKILSLWSLSLTFKDKGRQTLLGFLRIYTHTVF